MYQNVIICLSPMSTPRKYLSVHFYFLITKFYTEKHNAHETHYNSGTDDISDTPAHTKYCPYCHLELTGHCPLRKENNYV